MEPTSTAFAVMERRYRAVRPASNGDEVSYACSDDSPGSIPRHQLATGRTPCTVGETDAQAPTYIQVPQKRQTHREVVRLAGQAPAAGGPTSTTTLSAGMPRALLK